MNSSENTLRRLGTAVAVVCTLLLVGAGGAHATGVVIGAGSLVAEESPDNADEDSADPDEEDSSDDSSDNEDSDNSDNEDSDSAEPTDTTPAPTFTDPAGGATDDVTEMPTADAGDAGDTAEAGSSPLGWILLAGGLACAAAAVAVYRRNRHVM